MIIGKLKQFQNEIFLGLIFLAALLVYYPILSNDFVYDDYFIIVGNPVIQRDTNPISYFTNPNAYFNHKGYDQNYRPIGAWIFSLEFSYFQFEPQYYHALSIILHVLNAIILFFIFGHFWTRKVFAFLGSLVFLINPVQTEAIAFASEHTLLWASFFCFLTIFLILNKESISQKIYYLYMPLAFLTVFTKDQFVVLPVLLAAVLFFLKTDIKKHLTEIAVMASATILYILCRTIFVGSFVAQQALWGDGVYPTILTMSNVFTNYLRLIIKGFPLTINYDDLPIITGLDLKTSFSLIILFSFIFALFFFIKKAPLISLGLAWFFITLLTVANFPFPLNSLMNERFLYPALPGIIIAVFSLVILIEKGINTWDVPPENVIANDHKERSNLLNNKVFLKLFRLPSKSSGFLAMTKRWFSYDKLPFRPSSLILTTLITALLIYYGTITRNRLYDWKDEETLWKSALNLSPQVKNWINYVRALQINGREEEALKEFVSNGDKYWIFSNYAESMRSRLNLYTIAPTVNDLRDTQAALLANIYTRMKKFKDAEAVLKPRLRTINNDSTRKVAIILSDIYIESKDYDKALEILNKIEKERSADDEILFKLALANFLKNGSINNLKEYSDRLKSPNLKKIFPILLQAYKEKEAENWQKASLLLIPALTMHPINVLIRPYLWLGEAELNQGKLESAQQVYRQVLRIDPSSAEARKKLLELRELQKNIEL